MNFKFPIFNFRLLSVVAASLLVVFISARADDLKIEVTLSETTTAIGEPVELQIKITGVSQLNEPGNLRIDGLDIQFVRQSSQQMLQFGTGLKGGHTTSVTAKYIVTPQREGTFTIPPLSIEVGGKKAASEAVTLKVQKGAGGLAKAEEQAETAFAKIVPARLQAYVGEAVPMEVRIYVDARIQHWGWDRQKPPDLKTDSFTTQKWIGSEATSTAKNGRAYHLLVFRTAITPAKAGKLPVGPGEFKIVVQLPRPKNRRPHMGTGSLFDDDFPDPFGMFQQQQELAVPIKSVDLEVRPLPPGAPKSFAGAVGRFTFLADASPRIVHVGDPVTLTTKISGRGNFDRLPAPRLAEESGWRSYAPAGKFAADDDLGISGTKTFEMAVVPEEKKSTLPAVEFSFFDPVSEKYVTQTAERMTITTEGEKLATAATPAPSGTPPALVPGTAPVAAPSDILYLRTDAGGWSESLQPLFRRRTFWLAQTVPLAALLGLIGFGMARARNRDAETARVAKLRQEKNAAEKVLRRENVDYADFMEAVSKWLRVDAAIIGGKTFAVLDADDVYAARVLNRETVADIHALFESCHELRYAGTAGGGENLSPQRRAEVREILRAYERAPRHV